MPTKSLSMVPGIPIVFIPCSSSRSIAPVNEPLPPITTSESIPYLSNVDLAFILPSFVLNSRHLADFRNVPPLLTILFTPRALSFTKSSLINPSYPLYTPKHSILLNTADLTTALMAAFIPGASPPDVKTPIFLSLSAIF